MLKVRDSRGLGVMLSALAMLLSAGFTQTAQAQGKQKSPIVISRPADSDNLDYVLQDGNVNIWMFNLTLEGLVKGSSPFGVGSQRL